MKVARERRTTLPRSERSRRIVLGADSLLLIRHSAIWTALSAAPLRRCRRRTTASACCPTVSRGALLSPSHPEVHAEAREGRFRVEARGHGLRPKGECSGRPQCARCAKVVRSVGEVDVLLNLFGIWRKNHETRAVVDCYHMSAIPKYRYQR